MNSQYDLESADRPNKSDEPRLTVILSGQKHSLSVDRAFSLAHQLVIRGHLASATSVLEWLDEVLPHDRRIKVLQARCEGRQKNYAACNQLLKEVFLEADQLGDVPDGLQTAIVYRSVMLFPEARSELQDLCKKHPELPSLWLMAGDLWLTVGRPDRAVKSWRMAINQDDQQPNLVAKAAKHRIEELAASENAFDRKTK